MPRLSGCKLETIAGVILAALLLAGCGGSSTPQDAFKKFQAAVKANDYGTMYDCMTERTRNHVAGSLATVLVMRTQAPGKGAEAKAILDKYKVNLDKSNTALVTPGQLGASIKDQRNFIIETTTYLASANQRPPTPAEDAELTNVQVNGDVATGTTRKASGKTDKIAFRKVNGQWFIEMF